MATYGLRSSRSNGAVHAPHPDFTGKDQRPLCPATTKWGHGIWWDYTSNPVTCRVCLRLLGKEPVPKRMSAKAAVNKVLRDLGLRSKRDFSTHDHLFPMDQSGGFRSVEYTTASIYGDDSIKAVMDNAEAIIKALWTNKLGRHNFSVWVKQIANGKLLVQVDTDGYYDIFRRNDASWRRLVSYNDLPDRELYWGEEPADETPEKESETMTACPRHNRADERGEFADRLPVPTCDTRLRHGYGVWSDGAGGIVYVGHCAMDVANWTAAEILAADPDDEVRIVVMCDDHEEQPTDGCQECFGKDGDDDEQGDDKNWN